MAPTPSSKVRGPSYEFQGPWFLVFGPCSEYRTSKAEARALMALVLRTNSNGDGYGARGLCPRALDQEPASEGHGPRIYSLGFWT